MFAQRSKPRERRRCRYHGGVNFRLWAHTTAAATGHRVVNVKYG